MTVSLPTNPPAEACEQRKRIDDLLGYLQSERGKKLDRVLVTDMLIEIMLILKGMVPE